MKRIYLDNAATTKLDQTVKEKMIEVMDIFGNPSSMYKEGRLAKKIINESRNSVSKILNCDPQEIIFTGSGTESDNLAIFGIAEEYKKKGKHIITTKIEHHAVLNVMKESEKKGFEITYLDIKENGIIDIKELKESIRKDTILISIMYVNNEIGTIQPIKEISDYIKNIESEFKPIFHTDACQAINYLDINNEKLGVDLMTFSRSKNYGPKGIGVLYKNKKVNLKPIIFGGGQEMNFRSGTESLISIAGLTESLIITEEIKDLENKRLLELKNYFIKNLQENIKKLYINGDLEKRIPNNVHVSIEGVEGEALLLMLDEYGIAASTGSACSSEDLDISHVLKALNIPIENSHGSLRFSLGRETTKEEIYYVVKSLVKIIERLRSFSSIRIK